MFVWRFCMGKNTLVSVRYPSSVNKDIRNSSIRTEPLSEHFLKKKERKIKKKTGQARLQPTTTLTICHFQLSFGEDAASDRQCLADVVASVCSLHARDGQISAGWDREAAVGLLRLVGKQQVLHKQTIRRKVEQLSDLRLLWRWGWWKLCYGLGWNYNKPSCSVLNLSTTEEMNWNQCAQRYSGLFSTIQRVTRELRTGAEFANKHRHVSVTRDSELKHNFLAQYWFHWAEGLSPAPPSDSLM